MSICIGLCVYKNEFGLPFIFKNIERIQTLFPEKKIQIVVAYEESADCSLGILISKLSDFDIHILKNYNTEKYMVHYKYIANARNQILHFIRENIPLTKYLMMMDTNEYGCAGDIQLDVLKEIFEPEQEKEWDAVSFECDIKVYSAFYEFAIYKWSVFQDCEYNMDIDLSLFPEHRHFKREKKARICIFPKSLFSRIVEVDTH